MRVVIGLICNEKRALFITKRPIHTTMPGFWEFPGGKVQEDETDHDALTRELHEELGIKLLSSEYIDTLNITTESKNITFVLFLVNQWEGELKLCEGQQGMSWVTYNNLVDYIFPDTNQFMIQHPWVKGYFS